MNDHSMRDAYEAALRAGENKTPPVELPLDRLAALVGQEGSEEERLRALDVAMSSAEGRREFEVAWAAARASRVPVRKVMRPNWYAAAAVLMLTVGASTVWWNRRDALSAGESMRGTDSPLQLVAPHGESVPTREAHFVWHRLGTAREYMLIVVDGAGKEVFASTTRDTAVTLPDSIRLAPGGEYLWWVEAALADGSKISAVTEKVKVKR